MENTVQKDPKHVSSIKVKRKEERVRLKAPEAKRLSWNYLVLLGVNTKAYAATSDTTLTTLLNLIHFKVMGWL